LSRVYQVQFRFSAATLTAVFAVYVLVLLVTLLVFGSVPDYLGRLPVIIIVLVLSAAGCAVFLAAHGTGALYVARSLQGIATGLASGPVGAALIDLQPAPASRAVIIATGSVHWSAVPASHGPSGRSPAITTVTAPTKPNSCSVVLFPHGGEIDEPHSDRPDREPSLVCDHQNRHGRVQRCGSQRPY